VALAATWRALGDSSQLNAYQDAQHFTLFEEAARIAVARFHELPLWDPYYCGGIPGLGTPSARFASPTFLLTLGFGTLRGAALATLAMTFLGLEGTFRYVRARGGGALASMTAAPVFALSGLFAHATLVAWTNFYGFELVPWALFGLGLALRGSRRGLVITAVSMAWMIGFGGTYTAPLTALAAAFELACVTSVDVGRRDRAVRLGRVARMGLVVVLLTAAISMLRLWPVAENLSASPRLLGGKPGTPPVWVWRLLFGEKSNHWAKGDFLIGLLALPLVLFGAFRKKSIPLAIGVFVWVWFALGYKTDLSIFAALRTVPPYTMLRAPERFLVFVALAAATLAALGVRRLEIAGRRSHRLLGLALVGHALLVADTVLLVEHADLRAAGRHMDPEPPVVERDFRQARGNRWLAGYYPLMSRGSLTCFDDYDIAQSPLLRGDLPAEEYLRDAEAGTVRRVAWSPDRIDLQVDLVRAARVYVNQNWHPGWRASDGVVVAEDGLLAVDLPAGSHAVTLRFRSRAALAGIVTAIAGLLAAGTIAWRARRKDAIESWREWLGVASLSLSPLLVVPVSLFTLHEPARPPPPLLTPSGEPMLVPEAPQDTTPIDARWASGIVLDAAAVDLQPADENHGPMVQIELDWRFEEPVPPGLGVFLQFERQGGRFATDHVLLSGVLVPEDAPLHTVIRDLPDPTPVPETKTAATWKVYAGFWRARRDMSRMSVIDPGKASVNADRVLVGTFTYTP
jgi:hypothetical protein